MNSKNVLSKILTLLALADEKMIQAKTDDGTILQSSNFDVNDDVMEVGTDGKLTPAKDGEYTISFTTPEGAESTQVIDIDGGKVASISAPDEAEQVSKGTDEEEMDDTNADIEMSDAGTPQDPTKGDSQNRKDINSVPGSKVADTKQSDVKMADAKNITEPKGASMEPAHALPNTTDEDPRNSIGNDTDDKKDPIISLEDMHARLAKMEDYMGKIAEKFEMPINPPSEEAGSNQVAPSANTPVGVTPATQMAEVDEEELPKLDGAPVEQGYKFNSEVHKPLNYGKRVGDSQSSFLSKLYN